MFSGYNTKRENGIHVESTIKTITKLDMYVSTVVSSVVEEQRGGSQRQKKYEDAYEEKVEAPTSRIIGNIRNFVKY